MFVVLNPPFTGFVTSVELFNPSVLPVKMEMIIELSS